MEKVKKKTTTSKRLFGSKKKKKKRSRSKKPLTLKQLEEQRQRRMQAVDDWVTAIYKLSNLVLIFLTITWIREGFFSWVLDVFVWFFLISIGFNIFWKVFGWMILSIIFSDIAIKLYSRKGI